ncbi:MAG: undecaprenyldiphospho-muramoylpentapeptide beta-N-acetylglucosaminyltransferase [Actinomycetota bacterium]
MTESIVVAAGGTGGHLIPALAIADAVRCLRPDASVCFIGTARDVERDLLAAAGYRGYRTSVRPFGRGRKAVTGPASMVPATVQALRVLRRARAGVVVGMGGYPSLPAIVAARLLGVPAIVHEANGVPGLANEVAAWFTPWIAVSHPSTVGSFRGRRPRLIGVPIRESIARLDREALREEAIRELGLDPSRRTIVVFGGSLGAARLNAAAVGLAKAWRDRGEVQILLATGREHFAAVRASLASGRLLIRCVGFVERMELAYAAADVVVARAGASTVAELAATGVPAILIPLAVARRREQHANARALTDAGAAVMIENASLDASSLAEVLDSILFDAVRAAAMRGAAAAVARPDAANDMALWALELAKKTSRRFS